MTVLLICSRCGLSITGEWKESEVGKIHRDEEVCARLKSWANNPFILAAGEIGHTVAEKNAAYGSAFAKAGDFLKLLYPDGISTDQYSDMLLLVRIFDKQMRIATDKTALNENPFRDIAGYGILGVVKDA